MRKLPVLLLAAALLGALAPAPASGGPKDDFTFFGSGFGHGLGMSQWGSYGLALQGWGPPRILKHFYSGTRLATAEAPPATLRIGLVQRTSAVRLEAQEAGVELRLGDPAQGELVATIPAGETWRVRAVDTRYRILDASGATVARVGGTSTPIFAVYQPLGARVRVPEALHTYNRGWIELGLHECGGGCKIRLVLTISPQEYLYGLAEVPSSWPPAALRAQAIAARTYAFTKAAAGQHRAVCDCALYASSFDQVYAGWDKEGGLAGERWVKAVDDTEGRVIVDQGSTIQAFYMSSSGGHTENNENVWGGTPIPYLRGVCDPGDYTTSNPSAVWQVSYTAEELTERLGLGIGTVTGFANAQRGVSGRIVTITVRGQDGSATISGSALRSALGLRDDRVWIDANRNVTGAIREKYDALGCAPGLPTSRQVVVAGGLRQRFQASTIFFKEGPGAHELSGAVLTRYLAEGGPKGRLGFPTTDVFALANGRLRARFEGGAITCRPDGSSCTVT
jgi:SpoIID/LytB domain protein